MGKVNKVEKRIKELGFELPSVPEPLAAYIPAVQVGNLVFISGQGATYKGKLLMLGHIGGELTLEEGYNAAQICGLNALAVLKQKIGNLDKVKRIVKVLGWVNSAPGFDKQHLVINGFSELMEKVFGECGRHARSSVSANELPSGTPVEVEMIVEVET